MPTIDPIWVERLWAFSLGVISSIVASYVFDVGNSTLRARRFLIRVLNRPRLRRSQNRNDPRTIIRNEWAMALRDLGSKKPTDVLRALQSLFQMADILEEDEREVAREALRLRIGLNTVRDTDKDYLKTMNRLL